MNAYILYDENEPSTILYQAIAHTAEEVIELAFENNINIHCLTIELEKTGVKDQLGRDYEPCIKDALVH